MSNRDTRMTKSQKSPQFVTPICQIIDIQSLSLMTAICQVMTSEWQVVTAFCQAIRMSGSRITVYANLVAVFLPIGLIKNYVYVSHFCAFYQSWGSTDDSALRSQRDCIIQLD